jgi:hypothetical protein
MALNVDRDGELRVEHFGGGFCMKDYLSESGFN